MVIIFKISANIIILLNALLINVNCKPAFIETMGAGCDYEEIGTNTRQVPIILSQKSQATAFAGKPIYVAPDFNDILDQQTYNVYHEEVHGTILMPRVKFTLNNDGDCIRESDDYSDYGNSLGNSFGSRYLETRPRTLRRPSVYNPYRYARYPMSRVDPNAPVKVDFNGHNPTIEEMVPYMRRRHTPNTYIVMVDDPVVVVDSVPSCTNQTGNSTTTVAADGGVTTTTTTPAPARKRRQAPDTDVALKTASEAASGVGGGNGGGGKKSKSGGDSGFGGFGRKKRSLSRRNIRLSRMKRSANPSPDNFFEFDVLLQQSNNTLTNATNALTATTSTIRPRSTTPTQQSVTLLGKIGKKRK